MRLVTYRHPRHGQEQVGVVQGDRVLRAATLLDGGNESGWSMQDLLDRGPSALTALARAAAQFAADQRDAAATPAEIAAPLWEATLLAPLPRPWSLRDFYGFEQHVQRAYARRGRDIPPAWRETPVFYFGCVSTIVGPNAPIAKPAETRELDFELEVAAVIGRGGRDIAEADAWSHVAGLTILNDWSARDIQRHEMSVGLGPAKGKDFATSLGPWLVTLDELEDRRQGDRHDLWMAARINGEEVSRGNLNELFWTLPAMIARASRRVELRPGEVIASGTVGTGCLLELGPEIHPWLEPGDEVELEVERLGRLRNLIVASDAR